MLDLLSQSLSRISISSHLKAERQQISPDGLQIAQKYLGLEDAAESSGPNMSKDDAVFVAISFKQLHNFHQEDSSSNLNTQVGLAILDPRKIMTSSPKRAILTKNFASGTAKYCEKATRDLVFGKTIGIDQKDTLKHFQSALSSFKERKIILVGHHITGDLSILQTLGYDFQHVSAILDTLWIATKAGRRAASLRNYLSAEGCEIDRLRCAGNVANFTLRLLILLVTRSCADSPGTNSPQAQLRDKLTEIALSPFQQRADSHEKALKKKYKRREKNRERQSQCIANGPKIRLERQMKRQKALDEALATAQEGTKLTDTDEGDEEVIVYKRDAQDSQTRS